MLGIMLSVRQRSTEEFTNKEERSFTLSLLPYGYAHTVLMACFPGKPGLASCPLDSPSSVILILSVLTGQTETFHIHMVHRAIPTHLH